MGRCDIEVTLIDNEYPVINCDDSNIPASIKSTDAPFSWTVTAVDDFISYSIAPVGPLSFQPSCANVGPHMFTYLATDAAGNSLPVSGASMCTVSFDVEETYSWDSTPWSDCSASCGAGVKTRTVLCRNACGESVAFANCVASEMPAAEMACNLGACASSPTLEAILSRVQVTVDESTGTEVFTLNIEFLTGSNQPHQVSTVTGAGDGDNGGQGAIELVSEAEACVGTFSTSNPQTCFQKFRYTQVVDCDMTALVLSFAAETECLAPSCDLSGFFSIVLNMAPENYCEVALTDVAITGTLTSVDPGYNMAAWSTSRASNPNFALPSPITEVGIQAEVMGFIQVESSQVIIQNLRIKEATREGFPTVAMTGVPTNSDVIISNYVAQNTLSASKFDADVTANQGPAGGATGPFSAAGTAYCAIKWTEPTPAGSNAGEIGAQETEYVKITAEIVVDYLLSADQSSGRRRVLRAEMEPNKMPVLSWLPEKAVEKYLTRRSMLQNTPDVSETQTKTIGGFRKTTALVAPSGGAGTGSSSTTEPVVPQAVWYALIAMIVLAFCVCMCIGVVCCVAFKNKEPQAKLVDEEDEQVEPEVNIFLSPMAPTRV